MKLIKALLIGPLCGLFFCLPAYAQKTKAQITTEIGTLFPDNTAGQITPLGLRTVANDLATSIMPTAPVVSGNLACFSGTTGLLQDCGSAPATVALVIGTTPISGGITTRVLYDNGAILGEYAISGTGSVCMTTSCVMTTPNLGTPSAGTITTGVTLGGVTMGLGSDATGDIYYRNSGVLTRLPIGSSGNVVTASAGLPVWAAVPANPLGSSSVTGAATTFTAAQSNTIVSRSNSGAAMGDTLPGTSPGVLPAGTIVTVANTDTAGIESIKVGSGAVFKTITASSGYVYLCPGQSGAFYSDGSNYWQINQPGRCVFKANTTIYFATTGSATNDGLTASTPLLDPTFAYNLAKNSFDLAGNTITFSGATGTYSKIGLLGPLVGVTALRYQSNVLFQGNPGTPSNVIISDTSAAGSLPAIYLNNGAIADFNGFQITSTNNSDFIINSNSVTHVQNLDFHQVGSGQVHVVSSNGSDYVIVGNYTISTGGGCHIISQSAVIETFITGGTGTITTTLTGTPAFTSGFACVQILGTITATTPWAFSGAATGPRYNGNNNGVFAVGGSATFFPGNAAGSVTTGAQYN